VLWGRSVFSSIRKFLQFQLTVNFVALVVSFVGALVGGRMPLNVLQVGEFSPCSASTAQWFIHMPAAAGLARAREHDPQADSG
jgi:magnesium-transporting ATPase (P-type)